MELDIVPAVEEDWPWIVEGSLAMVRANAYPDEQDHADPEESRAGLAAAIDERRRSREHAVFVAVDSGGRRLGFSWADLTPVDGGAPKGLLVGTFVEPDARRRGIGRRLARAALDWAYGADANRVEASMGGSNRGSQAFHRALGFRVRHVLMERRP